MKLSVVIPAYNAARDLPHLMEALLPQLGAEDECLVVDDGSTDETAGLSYAPAGLGQLRMLATTARSGPAAARNLGAKQAGGDVLVFLDADVVPHGDVLARIRERMEGNPQVAAMMGSYDDQPFDLTLVSRFRNLLHCYTHHTGNPEASTFWSGCGAARRNIFAEAGGFDAELYSRPSIEDIEFGMRLRAAGHRILLDPSVQVKHRKQWTLRNMVSTDILLRAIPWTRLILAARAMPGDLNLKTSQRASALAVAALPVAVVATVVFPLAAGLAIVGLLGLIVALNFGFYRFLARCGGWRLALGSLPLHCLYFSCATVGFAVAWLTRSDGEAH
jgi:glycosyltransferase involved in cell wall biosynthesis